MKKSILPILTLSFALFTSTSAKAASSLLSDSIVVYRVGTGANSLVNTGNSAFLDEYSRTGTLIQSIDLGIISSGTASSEGFINRSGDGRYIIATGYASTGATSIAGSTGAANARVIARIDASGNVDSTTRLSNYASGNNPRSAWSADGSSFYGVGGTGGIVYATLGATTGTAVTTGLLSNIKEQNCEFRQLSITDFEPLNAVIKDCETIFHLGARGSVPRSIKNPVATHEVNATGTLNVLEIARESGAHVIFSSSSSVYGRNMQLPKDESMWLGPMTPYAASKLAAEGYVQAYAAAYKVPTTLLRFFNVFGPRQRPDHEYAAVLPKWIWLAMHGEPIDVYGDGTASRDFTYVDTVLDIAVNAMKEKVVTEGAMNLAYGNRIFLNDAIEMLKKHFPDLQVNYKLKRLGDVKESQNDPELLKKLFPKIQPKEFETALSETIEWLKEFGQSVANGPATTD